MTAMAMIPVWILSIGTAFPMLFLALECLAGLRPVRAPARGGRMAPSFAVLIPAHDEAAGIGAVIAAVRPQISAIDRIVVVADNCSDATAEIARRAGAEVIERNEPTQRGKAYALAYGRAWLRGCPPEAVVVLDADCQPEAGALPLLAGTAVRRRAAVQGRYLLRAPADASPLVRISTFAFLIKNSVRQRGLQRLSGIALLQGTGMAFPWRTFDRAPLETTSLVEDLKLGLDLVLDGQRVHYEDRARFSSAASSQSATESQRTRWEHGMLATVGHYGPRLLGEAMCGRGALLLLAADLAVPPLMLLLAGALLVMLLLAGLAMLTGMVAPFAVLLVAGALLVSALFAVWRALGRELLPARMLLRVPLYLAWKLPIYVRFITRRQRDWIRTGRA